jgi:hypothetical protein
MCGAIPPLPRMPSWHGAWLKNSTGTTLLYFMRLEVFMAVRIQVEVFWFMTPCIVVVGYQCFGVTSI